MIVKFKTDTGEIICMGSMKDLTTGKGEAVQEYKGDAVVKDLRAFKFIDGEFVEKTPEEKDEYLYADKRQAEYPSFADQLDAIWKGGDDMEAMRAVILGIKEKYPKPIEKGK